MRIADEITQQHYFERVTGRCSCGHRLAAGESFSRHVATATALLLADILDRTAATVAAQQGTEPRGLFEISIDGAVVRGIEIATRAIRAMVEGEG